MFLTWWSEVKSCSWDQSTSCRTCEQMQKEATTVTWENMSHGCCQSSACTTSCTEEKYPGSHNVAAWSDYVKGRNLTPAFSRIIGYRWYDIKFTIVHIPGSIMLEVDLLSIYNSHAFELRKVGWNITHTNFKISPPTVPKYQPMMYCCS